MSAPQSLPELRSRLKVPLWAALGLIVAPILLLGLLLLRDAFAMQRESAAIAELTSLDREAVAFSAALRTSQVLIRDYGRTPTPALRARVRESAEEVRTRGLALGRQSNSDPDRTAAWERLLARRMGLLDSMVSLPPASVPTWFTARTPVGTVDSLLRIADRIVVQARETADTRQLALAERMDAARRQALLLLVIAAVSALAGIGFIVSAVRGERQLRQRLELEEARLERTFVDAPTGMAIVGLNGRFLRVNAALCDMLGYSADDLQRRTYAEITHPEDLVGDEVLAAQLAAGAIPRDEYEKRYIAKDGSLVPIMLHGSAVRRADGTLEHFLAQVVDLRAQKAAQAASMNRKAELRSILDGSDDVVFRYDLEGRVTYANPTAAAVTRRSVDSLVGCTLEELTVPPDQVPRWRESIEAVIQSGDGRSFEFDYPAPDGSMRFFSVRMTPVRNLAGTITGVVEFSRDLTALRAAEQEMRRQEARFLVLVESSEDIVIMYDAAHRLQYANPVAFRATGLRPEQLLGKHISELPIEGELAERRGTTVRTVATTGTPVRLEYEFPDASGHVRHYDARMTAERDSSEAVRGVLVVSRDITDLHEAADRLAAREAELRTIVESTEDLIVRYDLSGHIRYVNTAVLRASHRPVEAYLGKSVLEISADQVLGRRLQSAIARVIATGEGETLEYAYERPTEATERYYATRLTAERDAEHQIVGVLGLSRDLTARRMVELERERLLAELTRTQAAVKTLKGLLPTCAWCHRIKDDQGHWEQMESYIARRTDAEFSHGLCPDCATKMMTDG